MGELAVFEVLRERANEGTGETRVRGPVSRTSDAGKDSPFVLKGESSET